LVAGVETKEFVDGRKLKLQAVTIGEAELKIPLPCSLNLYF
jgi:hypothetical protein